MCDGGTLGVALGAAVGATGTGRARRHRRGVAPARGGDVSAVGCSVDTDWRPAVAAVPDGVVRPGRIALHLRVLGRRVAARRGGARTRPPGERRYSHGTRSRHRRTRSRSSMRCAMWSASSRHSYALPCLPRCKPGPGVGSPCRPRRRALRRYRHVLGGDGHRATDRARARPTAGDAVPRCETRVSVRCSLGLRRTGPCAYRCARRLWCSRRGASRAGGCSPASNVVSKLLRKRLTLDIGKGRRDVEGQLCRRERWRS